MRIQARINKNDYIVIAGELNVRVENIAIEKIVGMHEEELLNQNGYRLREFCTFK